MWPLLQCLPSLALSIKPFIFLSAPLCPLSLPGISSWVSPQKKKEKKKEENSRKKPH